MLIAKAMIGNASQIHFTHCTFQNLQFNTDRLENSADTGISSALGNHCTTLQNLYLQTPFLVFRILFTFNTCVKIF